MSDYKPTPAEVRRLVYWSRRAYGFIPEDEQTQRGLRDALRPWLQHESKEARIRAFFGRGEAAS